MRALLAAYDAAGITSDEPPRPVLEDVAGADLIIASPLARSRESAARLIGPTHCRNIVVDDLFREVDLPIPPAIGKGPRLSPFLWVVILRGLWLLRLYPGAVPSPRRVWRRAGAAADRLEQLSTGRQHVVLVGHSLFNFLIGRTLLRRGWHSDVRFQAHWQSTKFTGDIDAERL
jgi:broad specificity phosphatase PhoE